MQLTFGAYRYLIIVIATMKTKLMLSQSIKAVSHDEDIQPMHIGGHTAFC